MIAAFAVAVATCWVPPVEAPVRIGFEAPACSWCPGHRGVEFATAAGSVVRAVEAGVVSFAGTVVGQRFVTVTDHAGWQETYGYLSGAAVTQGQAVAAGQPVGTAGTTLMFTVRVAGVYVDPGPMLGSWRWPARLVPLDGAAPRPVGPPALSCARPVVAPVGGPRLAR